MIDTASKTALMVAAYRARATERDGDRDGAICNDPWAEALAGDEGFEIAAQFEQSFRHLELWIALRTAYLDSLVREWTAHGHAQVVILGAGLDTRAARLARADVRFFEVDHPATQADKLRRLAALTGYPTDAANMVACDFERQDFLAELRTAGFDLAAPAVILWEGVAPYLTEQAVRATARRVAGGCHAESVLAFDFLGKRMAERQRLRDEDERSLDYVKGLGEPIRWGTNDVLPMLYEEGFRYVRTVSFDELALMLTGSYERERVFRFQHIAVASRTAPPLP